MKVIKKKKIEGCLESNFVWDLMLNSQMDKSFIDYLAILGKIIFVDNIKKPFFKIIVKGKFTLTGVLNNNSFRIIFPDENIYTDLTFLLNYIDNYNHNCINTK